MQGSKADIRNDKKPQPQSDETGKAISAQVVPDKYSLLQVTSRPLVSEQEPRVTGTLRADEIVAQSPSTPSVSGPHPSLSAPPPAIPASEPSVPQIPKMGMVRKKER